MPNVVQTLAGATEFDGTAGQGLVTFSEVSLPALRSKRVVITSVTLQGDNAATMAYECRLRPAAGAATEYIPVRIEPTSVGFSIAGCHIPVPRDNATGTSWRLELTTTGKTVAASLIVDFEVGDI